MIYKSVILIKDVEIYSVSDKVFICVAFFKHIMRFKRKGKLAARYINLYKIME